MNVSTSELSRILGVTARRLQQLTAQGVLKNDGRGCYALAANVQAFTRHQVDTANAKSARSADGERLRNLKADALSLKVERESKALINEARAEALAIVDEVLGGFRADLYALPARVTGDLEQRKKIEAAIDAAFREAAKRAAVA